MESLVMPIIGEIRTSWEIGHKRKQSATDKYIWQACIDCGKERWVRIEKSKPRSIKCVICSSKQNLPRIKTGAEHPSWNGGRIVDKNGYVKVRIQPDDYYYPMAHFNGYVPEHRLIVAKALGRCLESWEIVHHKEGCAKDDNRYPETLQLVSVDEHDQITLLIQENRKLKETIKKIQRQLEEL